MPFVITDPCIGTKDTACVDVCPVDCIHPKKDEPEFATTWMFYPEWSVQDYRSYLEFAVEVINHSIEGLPEEQKRIGDDEHDQQHIASRGVEHRLELSPSYGPDRLHAASPVAVSWRNRSSRLPAS